MAPPTRLSETDTSPRTKIHLAPPDLDLESHLGSRPLPNPTGRRLPGKLPAERQADIQAAVPRLRTYLLPPLRGHPGAGSRSALEYRL